MWQINWQIYPPVRLSTDALNTTTPHLADVLADLHPLTIEHRCLEYCYTKLGRSTPLAIRHRCLQYCYTKLSRCTGRSNPHQSSIHALNTTTLNMTDLLADQCPSIKHRCFEYCYTKLDRSTGRCLEYYTKLVRCTGRSNPPQIKHRCLQYHYTKLTRSTPHN